MTLAAVVLVVALACTVHGAVGFGMNLLAVPVLILLDPHLVPGPVVALGLALSLATLVRERSHWDPRLWWAVLGLVPGTAAALALLHVVSKDLLTVVIGALVLVAVAMSALRVHVHPRSTTLSVAGAASGFLATAGGIGGPPVALVYAESEGPRLRSNLSAFFVITGVVSLAALAAVGDFTAREARTTVVLLPAAAVGFVASGYLRRFVDGTDRARACVLLLSALAGVGAIFVGLTG